MEKLKEEEIRGDAKRYKEQCEWEKVLSKNAKNTSEFIRRLIEVILKKDSLEKADLDAIFGCSDVDRKQETKIEYIQKLDIGDVEKAELVDSLKKNDVGFVTIITISFKFTEKDIKDIRELLQKLVDEKDKNILDKSIKEFSELGIKGLQSGTLSPIFYALHPTQYPVINDPTIKGLNKYERTIKSDLKDYLDNVKLLTKIRDIAGLEKDFRDLDNFLYRKGNNLIDETDEILCKIKRLLTHSKNLILYGPLGTGKTYWAKKLTEEEKWKNFKFITFHQSYAYEEFVEGIKPEGESTITYPVQPGIFKQICEEAINSALEKSGDNYKEFKLSPKKSREERLKFYKELSKEKRNEIFKGDVPQYLLIIDEINRGNISKIFGELITLIEDDKRLGEKHELIVELPYSKESFGVPPNLYIIGTMNTADKSLVLLDVALRRRFTFLELMPELKKLEDVVVKVGESEIDLKKLLETLNQKIEILIDRDHQIGHSYFLKVKDAKGDKKVETLRFVWFYEIMPLLREYFYDDMGKLEAVIGKEFVKGKTINENEGMKLVGEYYDSEQKVYTIKKEDDTKDDKFIAALKEIISEETLKS